MLPNTIVIGAAKAGTTSLHYYLDQHPEVHMARPRGSPVKEMSYFWRDDWRERRAWYESHFDVPEPVRGEATPGYSAFAFYRDVPQRIHEVVPNARLIYLVRDPIERIVSHWVQRRADGDRTPFRRYMHEYDEPRNRIVCPSRYHTQMREYLRFFPAEQLCVVDQDDLLRNRRGTLRRVFRFIGVDEEFESAAFAQQLNRREDKRGPRRLTVRFWDPLIYPTRRIFPKPLRRRVRKSLDGVLNGPITETPVLSRDTYRRLEAHLRPEMEALRELTGQGFASWSV
jgi:hypothetical protein